MIEGARQIVAQVLTVDAINTQLIALNARLRPSAGWKRDVPLLPQSADPSAHGVQDMWHKSFRDITRPGVGYMVGILRSMRAELKASGGNRMTLPLWIECQSEAQDQERALQQAGLLYQAVLYVLEDMESVSLDNVTPPLSVVLVGTGEAEAIVIDAAAAGKILAIRARHDLTVDDYRS